MLGRNPALYGEMIGILSAAAAPAQWCAARRASADEPVVQFEEEQPTVLQGLGLFSRWRLALCC
jgi:hypothetical protein